VSSSAEIPRLPGLRWLLDSLNDAGSPTDTFFMEPDNALSAVLGL
jgi:hypothetical protein